MARLVREGAAEAYGLQRRWTHESLMSGQSLLTDRSDVWTSDALNELVEHFIEAPDYSEKVSFVDKLAGQLAEASDTAVLLMAELFVVYYLIVASEATGPKRKRQVIETILGWRFPDVEIPGPVLGALSRGMAHPGQYANSYPNIQVEYLIQFSLAAIGHDDWLSIADDPWKLRGFVASIETDAADNAVRLAILHLSHPDSFDPILNPKHKDLILKRFRSTAAVEDIDRELLEVRAELEPELGPNFTWWDEPFVHRWNRDPKQWETFCTWVRRFRELPDFDAAERQYKLELVEHLRRARDATVSGGENWPSEFKRSIRKSNLVAVMTKTRVADWVEEAPAEARRTVLAIWNSDAPPPDRLNALDETRPEEHLSTPGERLSLGSVLLMADGAEVHPPLKISALRTALNLAGWAEPKDASVAELYVLAMTLFDEVCDFVPTLRDRLDAQGAIWALTSYKNQPASWDHARWQELVAFRGQDEESPISDDDEEVEAVDLRSEAERRLVRYQAVRAAWDADDRAQGEYEQACKQLDAASSLALSLLGALAETGDLDAFRAAIASNPSMPQQLRKGSHPNFLAHAVNNAGPALAQVTDAIAQSYRLPETLDEAVVQIDQLYATYSAMAGVAASYAWMPPLTTSVYWSLQDRDSYPPLWASLEKVLQRIGWLGEAETPSGRYRAYAELLLSLDDQPLRAVLVMSWYGNGGVVGIDPTAVERCVENRRHAEAFYANGKEYPDQDSQSAADQNAKALIGDLRYLAGSLVGAVAEALKLPAAVALPPARYGAALPYRHDAFAGWRLSEEPSQPSLRAWVTVDGVVVGLHPGWKDTGWYDEAANFVKDALPEDYQFFRLRTGASVYNLEAKGHDLPGGEFVVGRSIDLSSAASPALGAAVVEAVLSLKPAIERLRGIEPVAPELDVEEIGGDIDHLDAAATDLLIDRDELDHIVSLLEDRRQVVLYGPPGTGKTYLAKRLARALAADRPDRHAVVQFHPATTYEDFIEGLRPVVNDGHVSYELQSGPLIRMAKAAQDDPSGTYVIVIDEINRANLPKVLGELLFLLEYRDEPVRLLYRPEKAFTLPKNLWFIGTMNTADRSIALVDAAMRRRFHFIGFFPHHGPMKGLLRRWLRTHKRPERIADFVDAANDELRTSLGDHLLLGPSFFMKQDLSRPALQRIWDHNIFPYLEEQFWGQDELGDWTWPSVSQRFASKLDPKAPPEQSDEMEEGTAE